MRLTRYLLRYRACVGKQKVIQVSDEEPGGWLVRARLFGPKADSGRRNSSVGRALDRRSKGPWFDPGFRQFFKSSAPVYFAPFARNKQEFPQTKSRALTPLGFISG